MVIPPLRVGEFLIGMFAGAQFRRSPRKTNGAEVIAVASACFLFFYFASRLPYEIFRNAAMAVPYAVLLTALAGWENRVMAHPALQFGGEISYSIYLLQVPVFNSVHVLAVHLLHLRYEKEVALALLLADSALVIELLGAVGPHPEHQDTLAPGSAAV